MGDQAVAMIQLDSLFVWTASDVKDRNWKSSLAIS